MFIRGDLRFRSVRLVPNEYDEFMNVVLIGYRASGKSTIGRSVAEKLSLQFVDIDHEIMARYDNKSVAEIWDEFGEPHYRETECDVTELACQRDNLVIALGGGTPMEKRAFTAIAEAKDTHRFFLKAPATVLYERSQIDVANTANRPNFSNDRSGLEEVEHMLAKREPVYQDLADHIIDVEKFSFAEAAKQIVSLL